MLKKWLTTPYGRKNTEALTGALLLLFLVEHFVANLMLLLPDPEPYRWYTGTLGHSVIVRIVEVGLFALFIVHIGLGLKMRLQHRKMMQNNPRAKKPKDVSTRFVGLTGIIILVFLCVHLQRFFLPNRVFGTNGFDLYTEAHKAFSSIWYTLLYVLSMIALALHLKHGIRSALFSAKFIPPARIPVIRTWLGWVGMFVPLGLAYIAVHIYVCSLL